MMCKTFVTHSTIYPLQPAKFLSDTHTSHTSSVDNIQSEFQYYFMATTYSITTWSADIHAWIAVLTSCRLHAHPSCCLMTTCVYGIWGWNVNRLNEEARVRHNDHYAMMKSRRWMYYKH
jgi:hypothetical protein